MVRRIFVEKKKGFDVEAQGLCEDIRENLGIRGLTDVRVLNRYDMDGLSDELYRKSVFDVFAEPAVDTVAEEVDLSDAAFVFRDSMTSERIRQLSAFSSSACSRSLR